MLVMTLVLSGCGAFAFDNYERKSNSVLVKSDNCNVEVHRGEISGGPAVGQTKDGLQEHDIRPDIDHAE